MIDTLYSILTDQSVRDADAVEAQLAEQASAGGPWLDEA